MNDKKMRPQDDLYAAVNHDWLRDTEIPPDYSSWGNFHELQKEVDARLHSIVEALDQDESIQQGTIQQLVRDFYRSGMDEEKARKHGLKTVRSLLAGVDECQTLAEMYRYIGRLHRCGISLFWGDYISADETQSDVYAFYLYQGGLTLPNRDYYDENRDGMSKIQSALKTHIPRMFRVVTEADTPEDIAKNIYALESEMAGFSRTDIELRDTLKNYNKLTYSQLQEQSPEIAWDEYFAGLGVTPPSYLVVGQPEFFTHLARMLKRRDLDIIKQYVKWHIIVDTSGKLDDEIVAENFEFFGKTLSGAKRLTDRWRRVIHTIDDAIGEALGQLYVDEYFPAEAKVQVEELVGHLKHAFKERFDELAWMGEDGKREAMDKLTKATVKIGYPEKMMRYEGLVVTQDSYLDNYIATSGYLWDFWLARIGTKVDPTLWLMTPPTVNAYYMPTTNEITFPAGILQAPFFDPEASDAENYGGIGAVIGHELTHGFDDQGSMYSADGNIHQWRTDQEQADFNTRAQVLVKQANEFEALEGQFVQGELTLGENIADIGGLKLAFRALKDAKSAQGVKLRTEEAQEFFENFARVWRTKMRTEALRQLLLNDPHAPGEFRANNSVRNLAEFYEAFDVKKGDKLYLDPSERVDIW